MATQMAVRDAINAAIDEEMSADKVQCPRCHHYQQQESLAWAIELIEHLSITEYALLTSVALNRN
jgi:hypothetical protein